MRSTRLSTYVETRPGKVAVRKGCRDRDHARRATAAAALPIVVGLLV